MGFELHLTLVGLSAIVPSETIPAFPHTLPFLHVLLPDVRQGAVIGGQPICEHKSTLEITLADGSLESTDIEGDDIALVGVDGQGGVLLTPSMGSVARMDRVKSTFVVDPQLFATPVGRDAVVARLRLAAGRAFAFNLSMTQLGFITDDPAKPYVDNFAHSVRLEIPFAGDTGSLNVNPLAGGPARKTVTFAPRAGEQIVTATLSNLCGEDDVRAANPDFSAFYLLEPALVGPFSVPVPMTGSTGPTGSLSRPGEVMGLATQDGTCIPAVTSRGGS